MAIRGRRDQGKKRETGGGDIEEYRRDRRVVRRGRELSRGEHRGTPPNISQKFQAADPPISCWI